MLCIDADSRISALQALNDPWLKAYKDGPVWRIQGINDFSFIEFPANSGNETPQTQSLPSSLIDSQPISDILEPSPISKPFPHKTATNPLVIISPNTNKSINQPLVLSEIQEPNNSCVEVYDSPKNIFSKSISFNSDLGKNCETKNNEVRISISSPNLSELASNLEDTKGCANSHSSNSEFQLPYNFLDPHVLISQRKKARNENSVDSSYSESNFVVDGDLISPYFKKTPKVKNTNSVESSQKSFLEDESINKFITVNIEQKPNHSVYQNFNFGFSQCPDSSLNIFSDDFNVCEIESPKNPVLFLNNSKIQKRNASNCSENLSSDKSCNSSGKTSKFSKKSKLNSSGST
ncbi:hypothetical protein AYI68_g881 [Smittium mucronatum]|uniref:Uncharacterized protein n=1 Tax=Smittium mucronatum TaxID=133383 RepID=A0A1R0H6X3_9FUNG|nr:hypothetical protein AYI68_g881 [Smittium mucronatum]